MSPLDVLPQRAREPMRSIADVFHSLLLRWWLAILLEERRHA